MCLSSLRRLTDKDKRVLQVYWTTGHCSDDRRFPNKKPPTPTPLY